MTGFSCELKRIPKLVEGENPRQLGITKLTQNKLSNSTTMHRKWQNNVDTTVELLDRLGINYVLIKSIDIPYAFLKDIDLFVENKSDLERLITALREMEFRIYKTEFMKPDKVTCIGNYGSGSRVEIDVYRQPSWWIMAYARKGLISANKVQRKISERTVYLPLPAHNLFILATHSYWHGYVTLAEVAQVVKLVLTEKMHWDHLLSLARSYHLEHPVYLYLSLTNEVFSLSNYHNHELQDTIDQLSSSILCRVLMNVVKNHNRGFPLRIPYAFKLASSLHEIRKGFSRGRLNCGELSSYFADLVFGRRSVEV